MKSAKAGPTRSEGTAPSVSSLLEELRALQRRGGRGRDLGADLLGDALRAEDAVPGRGGVAGEACLDRGRDVGQAREALGAGDGQRGDRAGLDQADDGRDRGHHEVDVAADEVVHRGTGALVGHVLELDPGALAEKQGGDVAGRGVAGRAVDEHAAALAFSSELGQRLHLEARADDDDELGVGDHRDRVERLGRVVAHA